MTPAAMTTGSAQPRPGNANGTVGLSNAHGAELPSSGDPSAQSTPLQGPGGVMMGSTHGTDTGAEMMDSVKGSGKGSYGGNQMINPMNMNIQVS